MQIIRRPAKAKPIKIVETDDYDFKPIKGRVAIFDTETDPFSEGRIVRPFTCGFYIPDSNEYFDFWNKPNSDCISQFFEFLSTTFAEETFCIFVHNGGNFDFYFLVNYFDEGMSPFIINGRLVRIIARGHEFRDSYSMIPVALGNALSAEDGGKIEIDYSKMEADVRELHKEEILRYQKQDCIALGKLVTEWLDMFGNKMTMASVALPMLRSFHGFEEMSERTDAEMRDYYFGGRCQAFETGIIEGSFEGFDINSSYPDVMRRIKHPIGAIPKYEKAITSRTHFARIRAWSDGALPVRRDDGGLSFPVGTRDYFACIHEIRAGLETGTLRIHHVYGSIYFDIETTFSDFIDTFYSRRLEAAENGDEIKKLFYKLVMNSSYGKFAQDPRKYENWVFDPPSIPTPMMCYGCRELELRGEKYDPCNRCKANDTSPYGWYLHTEREGFCIYAQPQQLKSGRGFFNVATAASITSAARASLLYGISECKRPIYCDTDSLICESLEASSNIRIDKKELGAWKKEFDASTLAIAGKKLYACFDASGECVKKASKGVKLEGEQIYRIASGDTIEYANPVPKFSMFKTSGKNVVEAWEGVSAEFMTRRISRTDLR